MPDKTSVDNRIGAPNGSASGDDSGGNVVFYPFDREVLRAMIEEEGYDPDDPEFADIEDDVHAMFTHNLGETIGSALDELVRDKAETED